MKIAFVSPYITTSLKDEKYYNVQVFGLAKELVKKGVEVDIYTGTRNKSRFSKKIIVDSKYYFKVIYIPVLCELLGQVPILKGLITQLRQKKYDIIQLAEDFQFTTFQVVMNRRKINSKYLILHQGAYDYSPNFFLKMLNMLYDKTLGKLVQRYIDLVITKTKSAEKFIRKKGYKNVETVPIGVDTDLFRPQKKMLFRKKNYIPENAPVLLYVGSFEARRNSLLLIQIIRILKNKLPEIRLCLIGDGPLKRDMQNTIEHYNLADNVLILNKIPNERLPFAYSAADLFILLSNYEIFGMVLVESMACGAPVVSTETAGAKDIINDMKNGCIVSIDKPEKVAEKIADILLDKNLLKLMGENARKTILENYGWEKIAEKYLQCISTRLKWR